MFDSRLGQVRLARLCQEIDRTSGSAAARAQLRLGKVYDSEDCERWKTLRCQGCISLFFLAQLAIVVIVARRTGNCCEV